MDRPPKHLYIAYLLENCWQWLFYSDFLLDEVIPFTHHLKKVVFALLMTSSQQVGRDRIAVVCGFWFRAIT
jgi:hypothetical protein